MNLESTRRDLLKGVVLGAGASFFSPILCQLATHAAGDPKAVRQRIVFVVQSNGMSPNHLVPVGVKRRPDGRQERPDNDKLQELSLKDLQLHEALEPLTPFKDRLALVQGRSMPWSRVRPATITDCARWCMASCRARCSGRSDPAARQRGAELLFLPCASFEKQPRRHPCDC